MGSLSSGGYLGVPVVHERDDFHRRLLAEAINNIITGKLNNTSSIKLGHNVTSTTVSDARCGPGSVIVPMPTSVNAGVALDTWHIGTRNDGSFIIDHVSTSTSDCTVTYAIFG